MKQQRKRYSAALKAKVALEAIRGQKQPMKLDSEYGVHPTQIANWKKQALEELPHIFTSQEQHEHTDEALIAGLYQEIGQLKVELDWLKKKWVGSLEQKRALIDPEHAQMSIVRQCDLLDLARSSYYYQGAHESEENLQLMRLLDEQYTRTPFYGCPGYFAHPCS